jgi:hypothetical protein
MCFELMLLYNHIFIQFQLYVSMNSEISDGIPVSEPASASGILYKVWRMLDSRQSRISRCSLYSYTHYTLQSFLTAIPERERERKGPATASSTSFVTTVGAGVQLAYASKVKAYVASLWNLPEPAEGYEASGRNRMTILRERRETKRRWGQGARLVSAEVPCHWQISPEDRDTYVVVRGHKYSSMRTHEVDRTLCHTTSAFCQLWYM